MKLLKDELDDKIVCVVVSKVIKHSPYGSHVRDQIKKNIGWWGDDGLIRLKVRNSQWHIRNDLDETN